jgi:DNA-binding CsgD family transcriptional regulator
MTLQAKLYTLLSAGSLRNAGNEEEIIRLVRIQKDFDELIKFLFHSERKVVMHAADVVEKISSHHPEYLQQHKRDLINLLRTAVHKELKWHLAQLIGRLKLSAVDVKACWTILEKWAMDQQESRIVRVFAIQTLYDICETRVSYKPAFQRLIDKVSIEDIPSIRSRIRKLKL